VAVEPDTGGETGRVAVAGTRTGADTVCGARRAARASVRKRPTGGRTWSR